MLKWQLFDVLAKTPDQPGLLDVVLKALESWVVKQLREAKPEEDQWHLLMIDTFEVIDSVFSCINSESARLQLTPDDLARLFFKNATPKDTPYTGRPAKLIFEYASVPRLPDAALQAPHDSAGNTVVLAGARAHSGKVYLHTGRRCRPSSIPASPCAARKRAVCAVFSSVSQRDHSMWPQKRPPCADALLGHNVCTRSCPRTHWKSFKGGPEHPQDLTVPVPEDDRSQTVSVVKCAQRYDPQHLLFCKI